MVDFSADQNNPLQDLYVDLSYVPKVTMKAGQFKPPFLMENLTPDNQLVFVERSLIVRTFADVRDIGFILYTNQKYFEVYGGEVNGSGPNISDLDVAKDLVGRIVIKPSTGIAFGGSTYWLDFDHPDYPRFAGEIRIDNRTIGFHSEIIFAETESVYTFTLPGVDPGTFDRYVVRSLRNEWGGYAAILFKLWEKHQTGLRLEWYDRDKKIWRNSRFIATLGYNFFQTSQIKWQLNFEDRVEQRGNRSNRHVYFSILNLQVSF